MATMVERYADSFDFSNLSDVQLRETFDLWAPDNEPSAAWSELYALGRKAIIEECHRRALAISKRFVTITCGTEHTRSDEFFTGTAAEFMAAFGLRMRNRVLRPEGSATGVGVCGHQVVLDWEVV